MHARLTNRMSLILVSSCLSVTPSLSKMSGGGKQKEVPKEEAQCTCTRLQVASRRASSKCKHCFTQAQQVDPSLRDIKRQLTDSDDEKYEDVSDSGLNNGGSPSGAKKDTPSDKDTDKSTVAQTPSEAQSAHSTPHQYNYDSEWVTTNKRKNQDSPDVAVEYTPERATGEELQRRKQGHFDRHEERIKKREGDDDKKN